MVSGHRQWTGCLAYSWPNERSDSCPAGLPADKLIFVATHLPRLATVVLLALTLAACGSDRPTRDEATREANSSTARQASAITASDIDALLSSIAEQTPALTLVATDTMDICHGGQTNGFHPHDTYRVRCRRDETRYYSIEGSLLLYVLVDLDAAARAAGLLPETGATLHIVLDYFAREGRTEDGLTLPKPGLSYTVPEHGWMLHAGWGERSASGTAGDDRPDLGLTWPIVYIEEEPVDQEVLWNGALLGQQYSVAMSLSVTYYEIPWED